MNSVIIFAGGIGQRMNYGKKPKQFLTIFNKEILAYTVDVFENHSEIDNILIVMVNEWVEFTKELVIKYKYSKVCAVIPGGKTAMDSQYNGIKFLEDNFKSNIFEHIVLMHDGVRPLVNETLISDNIESTIKNGNAISAVHSTETIGISVDGVQSNTILDRNQCFIMRAPQTFYLSDLLKMHEKFRVDNYSGIVDSSSMVVKSGGLLNFVVSPIENIKVTTLMDYQYLRSIINDKDIEGIYIGDANE